MHGLILLLALSWVNDCINMVNREAVIHNDRFVNELIYAIPQGIHLANVIDEVDRTDEENLQRCALSIAVARFESTFNPTARNKTCLGMYQITASTAKDVIKDLIFLNHDLKTEIYSPLGSVVLFNMLMDRFNKKGLYKALIRYNGHVVVTKRILKYYRSLINEIQSVPRSHP